MIHLFFWAKEKILEYQNDGKKYEDPEDVDKLNTSND